MSAPGYVAQIKAVLTEWRYWHVTRRAQRVVPWIAKRLPRWLKYWVLIDIGARYTASEDFGAGRAVPSVKMFELLDFEHNKR